MKIVECEQNSPEWHAAKLGKVSGSRIVDIMSRSTTGPSASRKNYAAELVVERLTGVATGGVQTEEMRWGHAHEDAAREMYEFVTDNSCRRVGLVLHPRIDRACVSPDRLVNDDGLLEVKCPNTATHIATLLGKSIANAYALQMQWQMACTGLKWCDFVSFDPRMPADMRLHVQRVPRNPVLIAEIEIEVRKFLAEVDALEAQLVAKYRAAA